MGGGEAGILGSSCMVVLACRAARHLQRWPSDLKSAIVSWVGQPGSRGSEELAPASQKSLARQLCWQLRPLSRSDFKDLTGGGDAPRT